METTTHTTARQALRYALNHGGKIWISYGQREVEGFVLNVTKSFTKVQSATTGEIATIAIAAIEDMTEL